MTQKIIDWIIRFMKGLFIGSGAILPGVSGGALAALFGIYQRILSFFSDIRKDFIKNVIFFIPVGIGGVVSVLALAHPLNYFLEEAPVQTLWCFAGCIVGTMPFLYKEAGKQGRKPIHLKITIVTAIVSFIGLFLLERTMDSQNFSISLHFGTWVLAGVIFALGFIVPGLSPSNFLLFLGMYKPMMEGIKNIDLSIIIPVGIGGLLCVLLFSRLADYVLKKAYAPAFHFIFGIVIASTAIIVTLREIMPDAYRKLSGAGIFVTVLLTLGGFVFGYFMGLLEEKYKKDEVIAGD